MYLTHQRLKAGLAIVLCWKAKSKSKEASMINAGTSGKCGLPSIELATPILPTKQIA
jgi:hypothetical protein